MDTTNKKGIFDEEKLLERMMDDEDLVKEVIDVFLEDIPGQISALEKSLKDGDIEQARHHAHTIKGASGNICAIALSKSAEQLETALKSGNLSQGTAFFTIVEENFKKLCQLLENPGDIRKVA